MKENMPLFVITKLSTRKSSEIVAKKEGGRKIDSDFIRK